MADVDNSKLEGDGFKYWAFISYSSKDKKVAKRLHNALESYKIPKDLVGRPGRDMLVPKKIFPVFRDRDELPLSSDLGGSIESALEASRYLIVLCSQNAAASHWVNEEIRYFKQLGRGDRILAMIVDGEPGATYLEGRADEECFPQALRHVVDTEGKVLEERCEPIAGDLRKGGDGWTRSFLKSVAGITGLGFDSFARREAKRRRRKRMALAFVTLIALAAGIWSWDYYRVKVNYFRYITFQNGEPLGLGEVTGADQKHRNWTYRFENSRRKVRRVSVVDGVGGLRNSTAISPEFDSFAEVKVIYRENGKVSSLSYFNYQKVEILRLDFSEDLKVISRKVPGRNVASSLDDSGGSVSTSGWFMPLSQLENYYKGKVDVSSYELEYDERGFVKRMLFLNAYGVMTPNAEGAFGVELERGESGEVRAVTSLGADGEAVSALSHDVSRLRINYDEHMEETQLWLENTAGDRVDGPALFCEIKIDRDQYGNDWSRAFVDKNGKPTLRNAAHHKVIVEFDDLGNNAYQYFLGTDGEKATFKNVGVHGWKYEYSGCRLIGQSNIGADGKLVMDSSGIASWKYVLDSQGRIIEDYFFGPDGEPVLDSLNAAHSVKYTYKDSSALLPNSDSFFGLSGEAILCKSKCHKVKYVHNRMGLASRISFFGVDGEAILMTGSSHTENRSYDNRGNVIGTSYFTADGEKAEDKYGVHNYQSEWDQKGREVKKSFHGVDGELVVQSGVRYAETRWKYRDSGRVVETTYWDEMGEKCHTVNSVHKEVQKRNLAGQILSYENFDSAGDPCYYLSNGYHKRTMSYNQFGFLVKERYYGLGDSGAVIPMMMVGGYHERTVKPNRAGHMLEEAYFGREGEAVINLGLGYHKVTAQVDTRGLEVIRNYWGPRGEKASSLGENAHHQLEKSYTEDRRVAEYSYSLTAGMPPVGAGMDYSQRVKYDKYGNLVEVSYWNDLGKLAMNRKLHYAKQQIKRRPDGQILEGRYFDENDQPVEVGGYHMFRQEFNAQGKVEWSRSFGVDNKPLVVKSLGYAGVHWKYNHYGFILEESFYGIEDEAIENMGGLHLHKNTVDKFGNITSVIYFGLQGRKIKYGSQKIVELRNEYTKSGEVREKRYFDENGEPMNGTNGFHAEITDRSKTNRVVITYWDKHNKPVISSNDLFHKSVLWKTTSGKHKKYETYGVGGVLSNRDKGFSILEYFYDKQDRCIEIKAFEMVNEGGVNLTKLKYRRTFHYEPGSSKLLRTLDFDADGNARN